MSKVIPVILSGGSGTRLWPLSRTGYPKQFHSFNNDEPLIISALKRVEQPNLVLPVIIANEEQRFLIAEYAQNYSVQYSRLIIEPASKNTAPAICSAAIHANKEHGEDSIIIILPSDHIIKNVEVFNHSIKSAILASNQGYICSFAVSPTSPDTGFGYIKSGEVFNGDSNSFFVDEFVEKPSEIIAEEYLKSGKYFWNSGIIIARTNILLQHFKNLAPELYSACDKAYNMAQSDQDFLRLDKQSFLNSPNISFDYAVMERADKVIAIKAKFDWCDLGTYSKLWDSYEKDENNNVITGNVVCHKTRSSIIKSNGPLIAVVGMEGKIIIAEDDVTLVADIKYDQDIKYLVEKLKSENAQEIKRHTKVYKPWGSYLILNSGEKHQVKIITVNKGQKLSLQKHMNRSEHWVCIEGQGEVTIGDKTLLISQNQHVYLPKEKKHRIENKSSETLKFIEVQIGNEIDEDDIIRIEDDFQRV